MLYVLIGDETSKVKGKKLKVKVEIKGENVRIDLLVVSPTAPRSP